MKVKIILQYRLIDENNNCFILSAINEKKKQKLELSLFVS